MIKHKAYDTRPARHDMKPPVILQKFAFPSLEKEGKGIEILAETGIEGLKDSEGEIMQTLKKFTKEK